MQAMSQRVASTQPAEGGGANTGSEAPLGAGEGGPALAGVREEGVRNQD